MRRSRALSAMALLAGAAVAMSACGTSTGGSAGAGNSGPTNADPNQLAASQPYLRPKVPDMGPVTVAVDEAFSNYNNNLSTTNDIANLYIDNLILPSPFFVNDVNNVTKVQLDGDYLDSFKVISQNPQVLQYNIKKQAVWSDGVPFDCSDFKLYWLSGAVDSGDVATAFQNAQPGLDHISKIDCSNDNKTATVTFKQLWADYIGLFTNMVPAHVAAKAAGITTDQLTKLDDNNPADTPTLLKLADFYSGGKATDHGFAGINLANDLSAGPYVVQSSDGKTDTILVRNKLWWGNPAGPSKIDIRTNRDDQSAFQQLQNKEVSVVGGQPNAQVAQEVRANPQFHLITGLGVTFEHIDYNAKNAVFVAHPELRTALSQCVNRQDVISKVVADVDPDVKPLGEVFFLPTETAYQDHYTTTGHGDETAAKKTLTDAGWTLGPNGFLQKGGQTAEITIGHKSNDRREATVQAIQAQCKQAGIKIDDFTSDGFNSKNLPAGDYQVALFAWTGSPVKSGFDAIYQSSNGAALGGSNYQKYSNPQVDKLLAQADGELNFTKRAQELNEADKLIAHDGFTLPLFALPEFGVTDGSIVSTSADGKKIPIQDNESSSGVVFDAFAWQRSS